MPRHILILAMAGGLLACNETVGPGGKVGSLRVQSQGVTYAPGTVASLTLTNLAHVRLVYSPCFSRLERRDAVGQWVVVHEDSSPCPAVLQHLEPGASAAVGIPLPEAASAGTYRIRFPSIGIVRNGGFVTAKQFGNTFAIRR